MPRTRNKNPVHLEVTGLAPLPPTPEAWERSVIEPALDRLFETPTRSATNKDVRDGEEAR